VRKAFGANKVNLLIQFIFENIVQTLIGGLIGFLIAVALIYYINSAQLLGDTVLKIDTSFYLISFLICILFGVLSGALPAYRMSRMHIVQALKSNQL
jgi:putative ABC transport system permease protein